MDREQLLGVAGLIAIVVFMIFAFRLGSKVKRRRRPTVSMIDLTHLRDQSMGLAFALNAREVLRIALSSGFGVLLSAAGGLVFAISQANAEMGPCRPDQRGGLICGEGAGAARVVDGTTSPSKRLAFAWRSPGHPPTEEPEEGNVETLLIRLSDGAALWSTEGIYWNTGTMQANRYNQAAAWSPNSRFVVETTDVRWWTHALRLFAIGADDKLLVLDLRAIIEPVVRKHLPRGDKNGDFAISGSADGKPPHITIDDHGLIKATVLVSMPKQSDVVVMFHVIFQVFRTSGQLGAKEVSVRRVRG